MKYNYASYTAFVDEILRIDVPTTPIVNYIFICLYVNVFFSLYFDFVENKS